MNFLSPASIAIAAAMTIPPLVALYFLKLKRTVRRVPSTLLWKRAVEDLQVNSPFQRLRNSLLLLLQLLLLVAAAVALGKPTFQSTERHDDTVIFLIDHSASMGVVEADGRTRLELAKEQAKRRVEGMSDDGRAMVIEFSDRASVVSSFDGNKGALQRKIDSIEPTQSRSSLTEAINLAEAYAQNIMIGSEEAGSDIAPESAAPPATVFLFTDGRIEDADRVTVQRFDLDKIHWTIVGSRSDNVGIVAMDARRNYDRPHVLEVAATVANFGQEEARFDAVLYADGQPADVQSVQVAPHPADTAGPAAEGAGNVQVVAFGPIDFEGGGLIEVVLRVSDSLGADDRAWAAVDPPRRLKVLLVTDENPILEHALSTLPIDVTVMKPADYEKADDAALVDGKRSAFDAVVIDRHSTSRLPQGNYFFWGGIPKIDGVESGRVIADEVIFNWDETHPILRHVAVEALQVNEWLELKLPKEAVSLIDGETSPVMAYVTRDASQFLVSAFSVFATDENGELVFNTHWYANLDFVVFMHNAVYFLGAGLSTTGRHGVAPGEPVTLVAPSRTDFVSIRRPDGIVDNLPTGDSPLIHYARTRSVGPYRLQVGDSEVDAFVVNLFNPVESRVEPAAKLSIGAATLEGHAGTVPVNVPAWPYLLIAILVLLLLEWVVYNRRVLI